MNRLAVIDIGTNSIKFYVGEKCADGTVKTLADESSVTRLGEGLARSGRIPDEVLERNARAVADFAGKAGTYDVDEIACIGTQALREAANSDDFAARVKDLCGEEIRIISGEEEAGYSYRAVISLFGSDDADMTVFDTGGGSTEFIYGKGRKIEKRFSVNIGAVSVTEKFFPRDPVEHADIVDAINFIDSEFERFGVRGNPSGVIGTGGGVTNMASVKLGLEKYDRKKVRGVTLTVEDIDSQIKLYGEKTVEERKQIPGLAPGRADIILAGACIVKVIAQRLCVAGITVSDLGARHGLALELFEG